jgi:hypothetical protein
MNSQTRNASIFTEALRARRAHLADLLALIDAKNGGATKIERLSVISIQKPLTQK